MLPNLKVRRCLRRKQLFIATSYITADAADYFGLPPDRTVVMGSRIEI
jgi:KUP system potassium uptake protein